MPALSSKKQWRNKTELDRDHIRDKEFTLVERDKMRKQRDKGSGG